MHLKGTELDYVTQLRVNSKVLSFLTILNHCEEF